VRTHEITMSAIDAAADDSYRLDLGAAWQVQKIYYNQQFTKARVSALHQAMIDQDLESPYEEWIKGWDDRPDDSSRITTRIAASDWFEVRDRALMAHSTQIDPDGLWFAVPMDLQKSVWPSEDFELARSLVETDIPETDLFAGLR
jgi:mycothiol S-conjugate amidase